MEVVSPAARPAVPSPARGHVVELRQYTMQPGRRDDLIELFESAFLDPLETSGMTVIGQFRDLDRPDRFTWLRGFTDMPQRARALAAFYGGPVWQAHRDAANATMVDSDNVLLLRPAHAATALPLHRYARGPVGRAAAAALVVVTVNLLRWRADRTRSDLFDTAVAPLLADAGADVLGHYVTEPNANSYPRLPVREGEHVSVWITAYADARAHARAGAWCEQNAAWRTAMAAWSEGLVAPPEVLRLAPTPRSALRG